jgi:hypothetical protein
MFAESFLAKIGIKPITDLIAGSNGIVSVLKESNDPKSKISSRKSAASALIFAAITMSATIDYSVTGQWVSMIAFALVGSGLLGMTTLSRK